MKTFALAALAPLAFAAYAVAADCPTLESRGPEGKGQRPTFEGQTRACAVTSNVAFDVTVVASGLVNPWAVEPLPDGRRHLYQLRDTHFNARGNQVAGQELAAFLRRWWSER